MSYAKIIDEMTFSFSRIHAYEQCPYLFYLKYIEKRDGESNFYAANGKAMHEVFEELLTDKISIDDVTTTYTEKFDLICEIERESIMENTFSKCMDYLCEIDAFDHDKYEIVGVEMELEFKLGKYKFVGFADLVVKNKKNGEVILVDHKQATHFLKKDGTPLKNQVDNFNAYKKQMYLYCKGLEEQFGILVDKIVWNHFKEGMTTVIPFDKEEQEESIKWALDTIAKIKKDKKFANKDSYLMCKSLCDYRNDCEYLEEE